MATATKRGSGRKPAAKSTTVRRPRAAPDRQVSPRPAAPSAEATGTGRSRHPAVRAAAQIIEAQKMLMRAGLRVLRVERDPVEAGTAAPASMEEVFDRRVASALQRLGMPDAAAVARLAAQVDRLTRQLEARPPKQPRRKTAK